jgi:hypothetical protein
MLALATRAREQFVWGFLIGAAFFVDATDSKSGSVEDGGRGDVLARAFFSGRSPSDVYCSDIEHIVGVVYEYLLRRLLRRLNPRSIKKE